MNTPQPPNPESKREAALLALRDRLAALPIKDPREALLTCFGHALETLTRDEVLRLRARVVKHFGVEHEFIDVVDGHLAWRELRAEA